LGLRVTTPEQVRDSDMLYPLKLPESLLFEVSWMREEELYERVYTVVRLIPSGRVATYGQVAAVVGPPCDAREVGGAMAALRYQRVDPPVPWQRVINAQGRVSTKGLEQQRLLEEEGVVFDEKGRADLGRFGWEGPGEEWAEANGFHALPESLRFKSGAGQLSLF
jgi:methylated-DNA-protein-cysteine methyltransferase-like protein